MRLEFYEEIIGYLKETRALVTMRFRGKKKNTQRYLGKTLTWTLLTILVTDASSAWKPVTLRAPLLLSIIGFTIALIALLEILSRRSQRDGGIAFAAGDLSPTTKFGYLYFPTLVAVCYSVFWAWVDLDAKRLEPYFQMSKDGDVTAEHSLFLHYPFDFIAWVPLRAFKRR